MSTTRGPSRVVSPRTPLELGRILGATSGVAAGCVEFSQRGKRQRLGGTARIGVLAQTPRSGAQKAPALDAGCTTVTLGAYAVTVSALSIRLAKHQARGGLRSPVGEE